MYNIHETDTLLTKISALESKVAQLKTALNTALPYMVMHGNVLSNDYSRSSVDATRREGDKLLQEAKELRALLSE